jgi:AI-2 transport protein TqsA
MIAITTAIVVAAALYFARSIFAPFAFALFIMAIVWPVQSTLQTKLPQFVALFLTLIATVLVIVAFGAMVAWAVSVVAEWMISHAARFQELYSEWAHWLEEHDILVIGRLSEHFDAAWMVRMLQTVAGHVNKTVGFALLVFVFMMLALLETGDLQQKLASLGEQREFRELSQAGAEIAAKFRKYMLVRTLVSALTGVAVWAFALVTGLELAVAWGIIAFALNYIPFIGPFVATILPSLFALAQFDSWQSVAVVIFGLTLIQFLIGNYLEP